MKPAQCFHFPLLQQLLPYFSCLAGHSYTHLVKYLMGIHFLCTQAITNSVPRELNPLIGVYINITEQLVSLQPLQKPPFDMMAQFHQIELWKKGIVSSLASRGSISQF